MVLYSMLQLTKTIIVCVTIVACVWLWTSHSPFRMYVDDCTKNGIYSKEYCIWKYYEIKKDDSWLRRVLIKLGE